MRIRAMLLCACLLLRPFAAAASQSAGAVAPPQGAEMDGITRLVLAIDYSIREGDDAGLRALADPHINRVRLSEFALAMTETKVSEVTVKERDRAPLANGGRRLLLEILTVSGGEGRVWTWRLDVLPGIPGELWMIADVERLAVITGLFRLGLDTSVEWEVHDAVLTAPDLTMTLVSGYAFTASVPDGPTALVFVGRGQVEFVPSAAAERGQVRIFCGADALRTGIGAVYVRMAPGELSSRLAQGALKRRPVDQAHARRAAQIFETQLPYSFAIDLNDLSTAQWSLVPASGDVVAEMATGKYGGLTYTRSTSEPEDISFFDRRRRRNIAVYASSETLAARGRFFSEDDKLEFDITHYDIDASFSPERLWIDGTATLSLHARATLTGTLAIRLADSLVVRGVTSPQLGRLLHLRVVGQNNMLIGLPGVIPEGADFQLRITYGGRLAPQGIDREAVALTQDLPQQEILIPAEPQWIYSNRSYWYPQLAVSNYATSRIALTVPGEFDAVATGTPEGEPDLVPAAGAGQRPSKRFVFTASQPLRYLSFIVSRFQTSPPISLTLGDRDDPVTLYLESNPREVNRARQLGEKAADVLKFYGSLLAGAPYPSFTLAVAEGELPGGHSPAYFALLSEPLPTTPFVWTGDPVSFQGYASFFVAHELAHQWWGQAIGWKNYHEQWLSEGFAQYFAAMYAEKERGPGAFGAVIRQMRRWAMEMSPQGPVYLGYRLGHIRGDGRVFRALVYDKGAMVLHMLRRLVGDEAFFAGLRDFYATWRYKKAGTDDFRVAMEKAAGGRSLERFFDRWIYASGTPVIRFTSTVAGTTLTVGFEQTGEIYDVPVTVTVTYVDGTTQDFVVPLTEQTTERTFQLKQAVRAVDANKDGAALAEIQK